MKATAAAIILYAFSIIFVSFPLSTSQSIDQDNFVQCLSKQSQHSDIPIAEAIYTHKNSSFSSALESYGRNLRFMTPETPKPLAIVTALHESHVQATVICSKLVGLQIRIRSGGHDYEALSYVSNVPFVVLDMFNLDSIDINVTEESAWIQAGASLGQLYYRIAEKSPIHGFPAGVCPTLGVGGHFGGGGYGNMMRKYGLSVDNIVDAKIVDVYGKILNRASMGEDVFWAIRGGGAASFGVVLSWKIKLVSVPENVTVFNVDKTLDEGATDLVVKWQNVANKLDENLFIRLMFGVENGTVKTSFIAMFLGQTEELLALMKQSFPELGLQKKDCIEMRWVESVLFWVNSPNASATEVLLQRIPKSESFLKRKSDYVQQPIPKEGLEDIWKVMVEAENVGMKWNPYGGKMSEISESATPFPHRAGNIFKIQYDSNWKNSGMTNDSLKMVRKLYEAMTPYVSKNPRASFLNYRDIEIGVNLNGTLEEGKVYGSKYFKGNFDRLVDVKTRFDPHNFFTYEQSIPTRSYYK